VTSLGRLLLAQVRAIGSRNACLPAREVPGGPWTVLGQRTYRTGASGSTSEVVERARALRSVTSLRAYQDAGRADLFVQVVRFASAGDARVAVDGLRALPRSVPRAKGVSDVGPLRTASRPEMAGADRTEAAEQAFVLDGEHARTLILWCTTGPFVVVSGLGGRAEVVRWSQLSGIVEAQLAALSRDRAAG
jgi:hypothetical protein